MTNADFVPWLHCLCTPVPSEVISLSISQGILKNSQIDLTSLIVPTLNDQGTGNLELEGDLIHIQI